MAVKSFSLSEGIDFSDDAARAVLVIGQPLAEFFDPDVVLKKHYLDRKMRLGLGSLSGDKWYFQEAQRAVNHAIGRVIRNKNDFGVIVLADKRYEYNMG